MIFRTFPFGWEMFSSFPGGFRWVKKIPPNQKRSQRTGWLLHPHQPQKWMAAGYDWEDGNQKIPTKKNHRKDETLKRGKSWDELPIYIYINW